MSKLKKIGQWAMEISAAISIIAIAACWVWVVIIEPLRDIELRNREGYEAWQRLNPQHQLTYREWDELSSRNALP